MDELIVRILQIIPYCAAVLVLIAAVWFVLRSLRANLSKTEYSHTDYLKSFQKLREEGNLTEEEFRIIKRLVSLQVSRSLNEPNPDYSLLNKTFPLPVDHPSGNIPKK